MDTQPNHIYNMVFKDAPDILGIKQVSDLLEVSSKTVYKMVKQGALTAVKVGREYRIPKFEVLRFLNVLGVDGIEALK